jgi:hypothetical protein
MHKEPSGWVFDGYLIESHWWMSFACGGGQGKLNIASISGKSRNQPEFVDRNAIRRQNICIAY